MLKTDKNKNKLFYDSYTPCNCLNCRNFCSQIKSVCPDLANFFVQNNIDIEKPFELIAFESDGKTEYVGCQYLVFGECPDDFDLCIDGVNLTKNIDNHPSTKEYDQPNFILDFSISLPNLIKA